MNLTKPQTAHNEYLHEYLSLSQCECECENECERVCVRVCKTASVFIAMANLDLDCDFLTFLVNAFNGNQMCLRNPPSAPCPYQL